MTEGYARSGWTTFAWIMFFMAGVANIAFGLAALIRSGYFPEGGLLAEHLSYTGWVWLIGGAIGAFLAYGIASAKNWGRIGGMTVAVIMSIWWFFEMLYLPIIGLMMIVLYVLVIYGLATNADEFS